MAKETVKENKTKETKKVEKKVATKKANTSKKSAEKVTSKKTAAKTTTKKVASKSGVSTRKATSKSSTSSKKVSTKVASKKNTTTKKTSTSKSTKSSSKVIKSTAKPMLAEYYDLPYRYNQTVVKILAQTPTTLFVYWDISDDDRNVLLERHGEGFFYETRPILIIHNITKNYSFEIEINDFANSWYIRTQEPDCDYVIELGRKWLNNSNEYIYIDSSNKIISPNDHILFEKSDLGNVIFKNVKTGALSSKDFGSLRFINDIDKLYGNVYDVYSRLYKDELLNELNGPTSSEFIKR